MQRSPGPVKPISMSITVKNCLSRNVLKVSPPHTNSTNQVSLLPRTPGDGCRAHRPSWLLTAAAHCSSLWWLWAAVHSHTTPADWHWLHNRLSPPPDWASQDGQYLIISVSPELTQSLCIEEFNLYQKRSGFTCRCLEIYKPWEYHLLGPLGQAESSNAIYQCEVKWGLRGHLVLTHTLGCWRLRRGT